MSTPRELRERVDVPTPPEWDRANDGSQVAPRCFTATWSMLTVLVIVPGVRLMLWPVSRSGWTWPLMRPWMCGRVREHAELVAEVFERLVRRGEGVLRPGVGGEPGVAADGAGDVEAGEAARLLLAGGRGLGGAAHDFQVGQGERGTEAASSVRRVIGVALGFMADLWGVRCSLTFGRIEDFLRNRAPSSGGRPVRPGRVHQPDVDEVSQMRSRILSRNEFSFIRTKAGEPSTLAVGVASASATSGAGSRYSSRTFSLAKITCTASRALVPRPSRNMSTLAAWR